MQKQTRTRQQSPQTTANEAQISPVQSVSPQAGIDDTSLDKTPVDDKKEDYPVSPEEKDLYHVRLSLKNSFDPQTGKRIVRPLIQKYNVKMWRNIYDTIVAQGYNVEILHDPTK